MAEKDEEWSAEMTQTLQMRVSPSFLKLLDEYRRREPDLPSRSAAIRRLVEAGAKAEKRPRK
jgi:hypothetical protein